MHEFFAPAGDLVPGRVYLASMSEPTPTRSHKLRTRIFLVVFFGLALLLSITTIVGTLNTVPCKNA